MKQKILVAFDDSENAMRAVEFVAGAFLPGNSVTLFHVLQDSAALCGMNSPELTSYFLSQQATFCALEDQKKLLVEAAMNRAREVLLTAGFNEKQIHTKVSTKKTGVARDIIQETKDGYTMVVLGRRGLSGIKEFILGSVSQKVLHAAKDVSVLVVN